MDYYEELGLPRTASVEEIRQAYKQLARLIHPDQQVDETLRRAAELQMKRLNMVLEVLTDPLRRQDYDVSLTAGERKALVRYSGPFEARSSGLRRALVWLLAAALGIAAIAWFFRQAGGGQLTTTGEPRRTVADQEAPQPAAKKKTPPPRESLPSETRVRTSRRPEKPPHEADLPAPLTKREPVSAPAGVAELPPPPQPVPVAALPQVIGPKPDQVPNVAQPAKPSPAPAGGFGGNWVYVPSTDPADSPGMYAPEYIEMRITERAGMLYGIHRGRYQVGDQAISPNVVFQFEGRAAAPVSTFRWKGAGGASGQLTLKLISPDSVEVSWRANQLSNDLGLISGVATLVRRRDP